MDDMMARPSVALDRFDSDAGKSYTLPAAMYVDPEVLRAETEAIFLKSWIYVGHGSEFAEPGDYVTTEIGDQRIYVIHADSGEIKAFHNVCQHRGHSLLRGKKGKARKLLVCPYHAWSYDHDGALIAAPNCAQVAGFDKAEFSIPEIRVDRFAGFVFVNLDPDARPMAEMYEGAEERLLALCPGAEALKAGGDVVFDIAGNWKNVADNLLECYHCSTAHKAFVDLVEMPSYEVETHEHWSIQWGGTRPENSAFDYDPETDDRVFSTLYLWPTMAFVKFPGTAGVATFSFLPTAPEVTHQVFAYHAPGEALTETEDKALNYFKDVLGPEDVDLVEDVQRGLHSRGYHQGRFMVDEARSEVSEHAAHHFQNLVAKALT